MRKVVIAALLSIAMTIAPTLQSQAFVWTVITTVIKKVIIAIDLAIQKLQNKTIWLQEAQKQLENTMSKLKLEEIGNWVEKQRVLYRDYYEELQKVKNIIAYYQRIKAVSTKQLQLVNAYKKAWNLFSNDKHFSSAELTYMGKVYAGMVEQSVRNIDQIVLVVHDFNLEMTDAQRLSIINAAAERVEQNYTDLLQFNTGAMRLSLSRAKEQADIDVTKALYGLQ